MIGFVYAFVASVLWGLVYAVDQKILENTSIINFLFICNLVSTMMLLPFVNTQQGVSFSWLVLLAPVLWTIGNFLILAAIKIIGASTASIIEISYPINVVIFCYLLYNKIPNNTVLLGGLLVFIGSAIIAYFG